MQRSPIVLAATAALVFVLRAPAQDKVHGTVRLGSWNIEHLGDPKARRGPGEGVLQDPKDLAHYIRYARLDALALQEITADDDAPKGFPKQFRTNRVMTKTLADLNKTAGNEWKHILFPKMRAGDPGQWTGIAWNEAKLKPDGDIHQLPVSHARSKSGSNLWDRNLHAMKFSAGKGRTDFVMMVLHLKANVSGNFAAHRDEEIDDLVKNLPKLDKAFPKEKDLIFVGDTNMEEIKEAGSLTLEKAGFKNLNIGFDTHTARGEQPFDRFFVPKEQPEFAKPKMTVLSEFQKKENLSFAEYRKRYSDHYIITIEIQVMDDDD